MSDLTPGSGPHVHVSFSEGVSHGVSRVTSSLAQLEQVTAQNWWGIRNLGLAFAALPALVAGGAAGAVAAASSLEDAFFAVQRATGLLGEEGAEAFEPIRESILEVARVVPIATAELADLAAQGAALGIANDALDEFSRIMGVLISSTDLTAAHTNDFARVINILRVPTGQFESFANTLLDVGVNTAATETEILNMSRRIAGVASVAGVSASEVLGLSAAVLSLGPRAEAGGTAVIKTFSDMARAIATGGDELQVFAKITEQAPEQFAQLFRDDATTAFEEFVKGLARLPGGLSGVTSALDALGITEARQVQALANLAQGTLDVGNEQRDLAAIIDYANERWGESTSLQDIAEARAQTLSGQLQILKNVIIEAAGAFGNLLLPGIKEVVRFLQFFVAGIQELPGPLKATLAVVIGMATVLSGLAAVALLVGPRILIAVGALGQLRQAAFGIQAGLATVQTQMAGVTRQAQIMGTAILAANGVMSASQQSKFIKNLKDLTISQSAANGAIAASAVTAQTAQTATSGLSVWVGRLAKVAGVATLALTALTVITALLGKRQIEAQEAARKAEGPQAALVKQMRLQAEGAKGSADGWLRQQRAFKEASAQASRLGLDLATLERIIKGNVSQKEFSSFMDQVARAEKRGAAGARELAQNIILLHRQFRASAEAAGVVVDANGQIISSNAALAESFENVGGVTEEQAQKLEARAQAHLDYIEAVFSQREAQFALKDSLDNLREAQEEAANTQRKAARTEREIAKARRDHAEAVEELRDAEAEVQALDEAEGFLALLRSQKNLTDDLRESQRTLIERALAELRRADDAAGDIERDALERHAKALINLAKLTNDLRSAQLALVDANQAVEDAEWQLLFLQGERAGSRDLREAEHNIAKTRQQQVEQTLALAEAEQSLSDFPKEVREKLVDAQDKVVDANDRVIDTEEKLADLRSEDITRNIAKAQLEYERALYRVATANAEVETQTRLMRGETVDAGDAARILANELSRVASSVPDRAARQRLQEFVNVLRGAPQVPDATEALEFDLEAPPVGVNRGVDAITKQLDELEEKVKAQPGTWSGVWDAVKTILANFGVEIAIISGAIIAKFIKMRAAHAAAAATIAAQSVPINSAASVMDLYATSTSRAAGALRLLKGALGIAGGIATTIALFKALNYEQDKSSEAAEDATNKVNALIRKAGDSQIEQLRALQRARDEILRGGEQGTILGGFFKDDTPRKVQARLREINSEIKSIRENLSLEDAFKGTAGVLIDSQIAAADYADTLEHLNQELADDSAKTAEQRQRNLQRALVQVVEAATRDIDAMGKAKIITDDVATKKRLLIQRLDELKAKFPELSGVIDNYKAQLDEIPAEKKTTVDADTAPAHKKIDTLNQSLSRLVTGSQSVKVNVDASTIDPNAFKNVGAAVMSGLLQGLFGGEKQIEDFIKKLGENTLTNNLANVMKTKSPSRVFREQGHFVMQGLILGLVDQRKKAELAVQEIGARLTDALEIAPEAPQIAVEATLDDRAVVDGAEAIQRALAELQAVSSAIISISLDEESVIEESEAIQSILNKLTEASRVIKLSLDERGAEDQVQNFNLAISELTEVPHEIQAILNGRPALEESEEIRAALERLASASYLISLSVDDQLLLDKLNQIRTSIATLVGGDVDLQLTPVGLPDREQFVRLGSDLISGLGEGVRANGPVIFSSLESVINDAVAEVAQGRLNPFEGLGENVVKSVAAGLVSSLSEIDQVMQDIEEAINVEFDPTFSMKFLDQLSDIPQRIAAMNAAVDIAPAPRVETPPPIINQDNRVTVPVKTDANPYEIANEITWNNFVRPRR